MGMQEQHVYTARTDPRSLKTEQEHLVVRIYDKHAQVKEYNQPNRIDTRV